MGPGWLFTPSIDRVGPRSVLSAAMTSVCEDHVTQCCLWIISEPRTYLYITGESDISPVSQGADAGIKAKRALWWTFQLPESRHQGAQTSESQFFTGWSLPSPLPPPPQSFVMILITSGSSAAAPYPPQWSFLNPADRAVYGLMFWSWNSGLIISGILFYYGIQKLNKMDSSHL